MPEPQAAVASALAPYPVRAGEAEHAETEREVRGIARGGSLNLVGAVCSQVALLGVTLLVARWLGRTDVGRYAQCFAFLAILGLLSLSGFSVGLTRFVAVHLAEGDAGAVRGTVRLGVTVTGVSAVLLGAALWAVAPWLAEHALHDPLLATPLRFVAVALPAASLTDAMLSATAGFKTMRPYALVGLVFEPLTRVALTALLLAMGWGLQGAMVALLASNLAAAVLAAVALRRLTGRPIAPPVYKLREIFGFSMLSWMASLASTGLIWADTILIGMFSGSSEVGVYNVATRLVTLATFVMPAINAAVSPRIADLYHRGRTESLRRTYAVSTSWVMRLSLPGFVVLLAFPRELLSLFGPGFEVGVSVTLLLAAGKFVYVATGPCGRMLDMSGRPVWSMVDNITVLVANIALNLWLIPRHGIVGAALAWAVSLSLVNLARVLQVRVIMRMFPFDAGILKALVAAAGSLVAGIAVRGLQRPPLGLLLGVAAVGLVYVGLLLLLGLSAEDRLVLEMVMRRFRRGTVPMAPPSGPTVTRDELPELGLRYFSVPATVRAPRTAAVTAVAVRRLRRRALVAVLGAVLTGFFLGSALQARQAGARTRQQVVVRQVLPAGCADAIRSANESLTQAVQLERALLEQIDHMDVLARGETPSPGLRARDRFDSVLTSSRFDAALADYRATRARCQRSGG